MLQLPEEFRSLLFANPDDYPPLPSLVYAAAMGPHYGHNCVGYEKVLEKGFLGLLEQSRASYGTLLKLFDEDKDGALSEKESQAVREFALGLAGTLLYDANGDWALDDSETDVAWEELGEAYQRHNEGVLRRFDKNRDGELSTEEAEAGRKQLERRRGKRGK